MLTLMIAPLHHSGKEEILFSTFSIPQFSDSVYLNQSGSDDHMIELHLYGDLRRHAQEKMASDQTAIQLSLQDGETVGGLLRMLGIDPTEVGQIFLNHKLLSTRCSMAPWLGYQSAYERVPVHGSYLDAPVRRGDRLDVFPTKMAMLVV